MNALAAIAKTRDRIGKFDRLGGSDTFFGRQAAFESLLEDEHNEAGVGEGNGMYSYHGMGQYGNIVSFSPTIQAIKTFLQLGYTREHLQELQKWYDGGKMRGAIDEAALSAYLGVILKEEDLEEALDRMEATESK